MNDTPFDNNIVEYCLDIFKHCKKNKSVTNPFNYENWSDINTSSDKNNKNTCDNAPIECPCKSCKKIIHRYYNNTLNLTRQQGNQLISQLKNLTDIKTKVFINDKIGYVVGLRNNLLLIQTEIEIISVSINNISLEYINIL